MTDVFDRIYAENLWNGVESRSGPGSGDAATRKLSADLVRLVTELEVQSVLDVGCGDGYWMPDLPGYIGFDWSRIAVRLARRNHPARAFTHRMPNGSYDLVICRDVIQHLPLDGALELLSSLRGRSRRYLLASTYIGGDNVDIAAGEAYSPDLTMPPFDMPPPDYLIFDGHYYHDHDTEQVRDPRKQLGLWAYP